MFWILKSPLDVPKEIIIKEGEGAYAVADILKREGIIKNKFIFIVYTFITGNEKNLQAGRYVFNPGITIPGVVYSISKGLAESDDIVVTIPEGFNVWEIDKRLTELGLITEGEFAKKYQPQEGKFFPDTYRFSKSDPLVDKKGDTVDTIAEKMKSRLNLKLKEFFPNLLSNPQVFRDVLIQASILEKEARSEEDMRLVAGVILNRLAKKMPLEIDATVSYGACLRIFKDLNISKLKDCDVAQIGVGKEITIDSPYNTYTRGGLPAGSISNPGIIAIRAVLNPQKSDYFYYLSTRDGSQIIFSKTASEHLMNRRKYLGL
jgi:UPF0755 protein